MKNKIHLALIGATIMLLHPVEKAWAVEEHRQPLMPANNAEQMLQQQAFFPRGIDPASAKGKLLAKWLEHAGKDPDWNNWLNERRSGIPFSSVMRAASPETRLQFVRFMRQEFDAFDGEHCVAALRDANIFNQSSSNFSVEQLSQVLQLLDSLVKDEAHPQLPAEHYTMEELLEANGKWMQTVMGVLSTHKDLMKVFSDKQELTQAPAQTQCNAVRLSIQALGDMPEPYRRRMTLDMLSGGYEIGKSRTAVARTLTNPWSYALDSFNLTNLSAPWVALLPAPGSHPLPYKRLLVTGTWENYGKPSQPITEQIALLNRNDNGVLTTVDSILLSQSVISVTLSVEYGNFPLKRQNINAAVLHEVPAYMPASQFEALTRAIPKPLAHYDLPIAQPAEDKATTQHLQTSALYPASKVYPTLTGDAVDIIYQIVDAQGNTVFQGRDVFLYDYGYAITMLNLDENGLSTFDIQSIAMQQ